MLIEFWVKNLLSFRDKQGISLLPVGKNSTQFDTGTTYEPHALPLVGLFGPNGAGKSNLIFAMSYMADSLRYSGRLDKGEAVPVPTFGFSKDADKSAAEMEITFVIDGTIWRYGFKMSPMRVHGEWLFARRRGSSERSAFVRDENAIVISPWVKGEKQSWIRTTLSNQLLLSKIAENNDGEISEVFSYIVRSIFIVDSSRSKSLGFFTSRRCMDGENIHVVESFLQSLGVDIDGLEIEAVDDEAEGVRTPDRSHFSGKVGGKPQSYQVNFLRDLDEDTAIAIDIEAESSGNQSLFHMAAPILDALHNGTVLVIDEIDNSLHTSVLKKIVEMWVDKSVNIKNSQLIFTAHDTSVMNDGRLEKDQVYLVQKNADRSSEIFSLADVEFEDGERPRRTASFGKQYLSGRFGALPEFDPKKLLATLVRGL